MMSRSMLCYVMILCPTVAFTLLWHDGNVLIINADLRLQINNLYCYISAYSLGYSNIIWWICNSWDYWKGGSTMFYIPDPSWNRGHNHAFWVERRGHVRPLDMPLTSRHANISYFLKYLSIVSRLELLSSFVNVAFRNFANLCQYI